MVGRLAMEVLKSRGKGLSLGLSPAYNWQKSQVCYAVQVALHGSAVEEVVGVGQPQNVVATAGILRSTSVVRQNSFSAGCKSLM